MTRCGLIMLCLLGGGVASRAASNVSAVDKYAWGENIGWTNWHDAGSPAGSQGVHVGPTFLSGFVWAENVGWINLGDGTPANGVFYSNVNGADFGVNRDPDTDELDGLAWGENVGWVNFGGGAAAIPPQAAWVDRLTCALRGFVWGENVGWVRLDAGSRDVGLTGSACGTRPGDTNCDGFVNFDDIDPFVLALSGQAGYEAQYPDCRWLNADCDVDGDVDFDDIDAFVALLGG